MVVCDDLSAAYSARSALHGTAWCCWFVKLVFSTQLAARSSSQIRLRQLTRESYLRDMVADGPIDGGGQGKEGQREKSSITDQLVLGVEVEG